MTRLTSSMGPRVAVVLGILALAVAVLPGCDPQGYNEDAVYPLRLDPIVVSLPQSDPPEMDPPGYLGQLAGYLEAHGGKLIQPQLLKEKDRSDLDKALADTFGTPAHPTVKGKMAESEETIANTLKLDDNTLAEGSLLYRQHCLHCHGIAGDGRGPTGSWVNPHPRDYRLGKFKFTSSDQQAGSRKARREDLLRTLRQGIEGTSMPSFGLLKEGDLKAIIAYVMHLSMRGQVEVMVLRALLPDNKPEGKLEVEDEAKEMPAYVAWATSYVAGQWAAESDAQPITPADYPVYTPEEFKQSVQRGYQTFIKTEGAGCASCHIDFGRKNTYKWDEWGTVVRPANLLNGVYRGGRRPMDLYWRIHGGINGAQMPQLSNAFETPTGIWDMVNFVQVLPYPEMRKKYGVEIPE